MMSLVPGIHPNLAYDYDCRFQTVFVEGLMQTASLALPCIVVARIGIPIFITDNSQALVNWSGYIDCLVFSCSRGLVDRLQCAQSLARRR